MSNRSPRPFFNFSRLGGLISRGLFRSQEAVRTTVELKVHIACDEETGRWYIAESDVPGLRLEADSAVSLITRIQEAAPELIDLNLDEIIEACLEKMANESHPCDRQTFRPSLRPVFDSPMTLAHA